MILEDLKFTRFISHEYTFFYVATIVYIYIYKPYPFQGSKMSLSVMDEYQAVVIPRKAISISTIHHEGSWSR